MKFSFSLPFHARASRTPLLWLARKSFRSLYLPNGLIGFAEPVVLWLWGMEQGSISSPNWKGLLSIWSRILSSMLLNVLLEIVGFKSWPKFKHSAHTVTISGGSELSRMW